VPIGLYMDVHVPKAITDSLRLRGIDVLTAQEDGTSTLEDPALLDRATELGRALMTQDHDLLVEATRRQREGFEFAGVIFGHQLQVSIRQAIDGLAVIAGAGTAEDVRNQVFYLPF
jgi:uncharacterized protein DUF5615